eukprot:5353524-Prymnesium_polylepis.1
MLREERTRAVRAWCKAWDNGYTHRTRGLRFVRPSGHVASCIARRPAFSHGVRPRPPASAVSRRETPLTMASASP